MVIKDGLFLNDMFGISSAPHPPEDLNDQGEKVNGCSCSAASEKWFMTMLLVTSDTEPADHLRRRRGNCRWLLGGNQLS